MKNDTFNQIINANLASIDPGFGQFALAKASSDLMKKVLNKYGFPIPTNHMAGCRGSQRTTAARFSYEGSSPDCHRARRPHPGILRPLSFPVERPPQPPAGAAWVCPTRRPHTPTYADDGGFQSVIPAASAAWRRPRLPQWSWAAAWAIGHMRTTGRPWRAERACRRPPIWTGPPKSVGIRSARTRQSRQDPRASYRSTGTCSRPSSTAWSPRRSPNH